MKRQKYREIIRDHGLFVYRALLDVRTPIWAKWAFILMIVYVISPVDMLPDWIPILGIADDVVIIVTVINFIKWKLPHHLMEDLMWKVHKGG